MVVNEKYFVISFLLCIRTENATRKKPVSRLQKKTPINGYIDELIEFEGLNFGNIRRITLLEETSNVEKTVID